MQMETVVHNSLSQIWTTLWVSQLQNHDRAQSSTLWQTKSTLPNTVQMRRFGDPLLAAGISIAAREHNIPIRRTANYRWHTVGVSQSAGSGELLSFGSGRLFALHRRLSEAPPNMTKLQCDLIAELLPPAAESEIEVSYVLHID